MFNQYSLGLISKEDINISMPNNNNDKYGEFFGLLFAIAQAHVVLEQFELSKNILLENKELLEKYNILINHALNPDFSISESILKYHQDFTEIDYITMVEMLLDIYKKVDTYRRENVCKKEGCGHYWHDINNY